MSTPIDLNVVMPYGYTVGKVLDMVWQARVDGGGSHIDLPEGPCRVMASWAGPERAVLALVTPEKRTVLAEIPAQAGGGSRTSRMVTVGAVKGDQVRLECYPRTTTTATGTIEIYPLPTE